jgi:hypothetical protein
LTGRFVYGKHVGAGLALPNLGNPWVAPAKTTILTFYLEKCRPGSRKRRGVNDVKTDDNH